MADQWPLVIAGMVTALITYTLPKLIEGVFRRRVTDSEAEAAYESIEELRWKKAVRDNNELLKENARLRAALRRHGFDPNDVFPDEDGRQGG